VMAKMSHKGCCNEMNILVNQNNILEFTHKKH